MRSGAAQIPPRAHRPLRALEPGWGRSYRAAAALLLAGLLALGLLWLTGALEHRSGSVTAAGGKGVAPSLVTGTLRPGEVLQLRTVVKTLPVPPSVDALLLQDETGSFQDAIGKMKSLVGSDLVPALNATGASYATGVAGFRDYSRHPWGDTGDWVYRLLAPLALGGAGFSSGVPQLVANGGADEPEAQLEALAYLSNPEHAAIDSNGDGSVSGPSDTPAGAQPHWRRTAKRVVLLATDADCHTVNDGTGWPGDPNITSPGVVGEMLKKNGITVIGLVPPAGVTTCVSTLARITGGTLQRTNVSGSDVATAIVAGLHALPVTIRPRASCTLGASLAISPSSAKVPSGTDAPFAETILASGTPAKSGIATCNVAYLVDGKLDPRFVQHVQIRVVAPSPRSAHLRRPTH
jgi:hypothetical protein